MEPGSLRWQADSGSTVLLGKAAKLFVQVHSVDDGEDLTGVMVGIERQW